MRDLSDCFLYGILDLAYADRSRLPEMTRSLIAGGVDLIQLRGKDASIADLTGLAAKLHRITSERAVPLVVNDHAQVARDVPVEGVHVGQDDASVSAVRETVNRPVWVGKSTHSLDQAMAAQREGADYIGFGPLYATPTKPDYIPIGLELIKDVHRKVSLPVFCIGGIKLRNLAEVIAAGARRVVIVSGLLQADDVIDYARACKQLLTSSTPTASTV